MLRFNCDLVEFVAAFKAECIKDERLQSMPFVSVYMLVHTDDANMACASVTVMDHITAVTRCHTTRGQ